MQLGAPTGPQGIGLEQAFRFGYKAASHLSK
jgi:hypothetical protein